MSQDSLLTIAGLVVLLLLSAFFSGSETALLSLDTMRVKYLVHKKRRGALRLEAVLSKPDDLLGAILVGNNLVNIATSVFATTLFVRLFGARGELLTILILTPVLLILAEVCPKTFAARFPERVSFWVLRPIQAVMLVLRPVVWLVTSVSRLVNHFVRSEPRPVISEEEIRTMIAVGEQAGVVPKDKRRMLHGVFQLSRIRVRDVMIPRTEVVGIDVTASFEQALEVAQFSHHSRFPVYENGLDNIIGIIHSKDILRYVCRPEEFSLRRLARRPYFVPEAKLINTLLQAFQRKRIHLAVVVDEYGGVEGIVTLEDVVEEIVGEIRDEYDDEEILLREVAYGCFLVDGSISLRTVNQRFGLELSEEHASTLAGFLLHTLGAIPQEGDRCTVADVLFIVRRVVARRIEEIELRLPEEKPPA
jgi:putative hemolysin